ncbi:MAG TPA: carbohydrate kinase family protein [Longimicrobiaceae bacterium]|nr:carbohydrate kinase family protein [Longimicrobiaceae bacterium]
MKIGALGTLVWDVNRHPSLAAGGGSLEQWGGATYSLAALSAARAGGWVVEPIIKVGADVADRASELLAALPGVVAGAGVRVVPERNNRVELLYHDRNERREQQSGGVPPWTWEEIEPLLGGLNALYVNFISGRELDLSAAERVRSAFRGTIHGDLHSLFLGPAGDRPRAPRALPEWRRWVACFDVVQLNETELRLLAAGRSPDDRFLRGLLDLGPRAVAVTLGERGVRFAAREGGVERTGIVPPPGGALQGDPTGCGDVWGGAFFALLMGGTPLEDAVAAAQRYAAEKMRDPATATLPGRLRALRAAS